MAISSPLGLAATLTFAPLVHALQDFRVPRAISVIGVVLLAFSIIFVIGGVIATQMTQLAGELPRYESNMRRGDRICVVAGTI